VLRVSYVLGIDLGTTYTSAAVAEGSAVEVVQLGTRSSVIPTVVFLTEDGELLTGDAANRRGVTAPTRVAREFKRRVGDTAPLLLGGTPMAPQALMGTILRTVVDRVTAERGNPPAHVAVSHPANWGPYKLDLLGQAVRLADLPFATTISEPEAAACYYSSTRRLAAGEIVAVYDLGGGTFDAAVVQASDSGFRILGVPEGIEHLGGIDVDEAVLGFVSRALGGALERLDLDDPVVIAAAARLRRDCVEAKEALSSDTETVIPVMLPGLQSEVRITRAELEAMVQPSLRATVGALQRAIRSAEITAADLSAVLLVGGTSRMPMVAKLVGEALGRPVAVDAHPKHAVCLGTALTARTALARAEGRVEPAAEVVAPRITPPPSLPPDAPSAAHSPPAAGRETITSPTPPAKEPPAVMAHAAPLEPPTAFAPPEPPEPAATKSAPSPSPRGRRRLLLYIGAPLAVVIAVVAVIATRGGDSGGSADDAPVETTASTGPSSSEPATTAAAQTTAAPATTASAPTTAATTTTAGPPPSTVASPRVASLAVGRTLPAGDLPDGIAKDGAGRLWIAAAQGDQVSRVDPATGAAQAIDMPAGSWPLAVLADGNTVYASLYNGSAVAAIDPDTMAYTPIPVSELPEFLAWGAGSLWSISGQGALDRIDVTTGTVIAHIPVDTPKGVVIAGNAAWVTEQSTGQLARVDLATNQVVARYAIGNGPDSLATDGEAIWVCDRGDGMLARFDLTTLDVTAWVDVGTAPSAITIDGDRVWVTDITEGTLVLVDRTNPSVVTSVDVGDGPLSIVALGDTVWVSLTNENAMAEVTVERAA
jgi:sugar lactone lactonase YvrE/actin-like ATPase involved in cell morphogenesis